MRHRFRIALLLGISAYALFLALNTSPVAAGSDSAGYLLNARLLTEGRFTSELRTVPDLPPGDPWEFTPLGMIYSEPLRALVPTYPIGLAIVHALAATVAGWHWGPIIVSVLMACGSLAGTFLCVREVGVRRELAAVAAVALAACPVLLHTSFIPLSDPASTCWSALAIGLALRAARLCAVRLALAAGVCFALAVLIRPSNALLLPALALALRAPRLLAASAVAGLPFAGFLAWYHQTYYGSVFTTGYGSVWSIFGWEYLRPALRQYLIWVPAFLPVGAAGLLLLPRLPWRSRWREGAVLLLWAAAFGVFYAFYQPTHENRWYLRFVLPAFPALLALAAMAVERILQPLSTARCIVVGRGAVAAGLVLSLGSSVYHWHAERLGRRADDAAVFAELPRWVDAHLPRDAVILTFYPSGSFYFYTDRPIVRSDVITRPRFEALVALARAREWPVYALLARDEETSLKDRIAGSWVEERRMGEFGIWRLELPVTSS